MNTDLIRSLCEASVYPHECKAIEVLETHISWIILTGDYAYKIKKPVNFGFLDFTTLAKRKQYCEAELTLNRRSAPDLYLGLVALRGTAQNPSFQGSEPVLEYAVKMHQFEKGQLFIELHDNEKLQFEHIDELAGQVSDFHNHVAVETEIGHFGDPEHVYAAMQQNFEQIRDLIPDKKYLNQLEQLEAWTRSTYERLAPILTLRKQQGFVRECHGDLHMGNITLFNRRVTLFDCIEFNDGFRWIDVISDIAFLVMDFEAHELPHFANRFLNLYLERTGDYAGLKVLSFYKAYRAVVRAKIALFSLNSPGMSDQKKAQLLNQYQEYINLAESYSGLPNRFMLIMHGVSGTGKSTIALRLVDRLGLIRIRSDIERKRLFGLSANTHTNEDQAREVYSGKSTRLTYQKLASLCEEILDSGLSVIIDATNLKHWQRETLQKVADARGVPTCIAFCEASIPVIREWIEKRTREAVDASEADIGVVQDQIKTLDPLSKDELKQTFVIHSNILEETNELVSEIKKHLH